MARSIAIPIVVLAVVLAGCNGFLPGSSGGTPTGTVTPVAVPTDEPTPTPVPRLAPGLTGEGVTDPVALAAAHAGVLNDRSFTVHDETLVRFANGTIPYHTTIDAELATNDSRYLLELEQPETALVMENNSIAVWSDGERIVSSRTYGDNTSYGVPRDVNGEPASPDERYWTNWGFDPVGYERIYTLFGAAEMRVVDETTRNGTTRYELAATNVTNPARFGSAAGYDPRNVSFRVWVTQRGLVRAYHVEYVGIPTDRGLGSGSNETVTVRHTVRYSDVGTTTVERPPWYDEAIANISTATTTA